MRRTQSPNSHLETQEVRCHSLLIAGIPSRRTGIGSVWWSSPAMALRSKNNVQAAQQDLQRDDGQEDDHDKGDCRSIRPFPIGMGAHWQHSSLRKLQERYALVAAFPPRASNVRSTAIFGPLSHLVHGLTPGFPNLQPPTLNANLVGRPRRVATLRM